MYSKKRNAGFAIAVAWPETLCKQPGTWYDTPMTWAGFNKNWFYRAGHAALILVDGKTSGCHYYDFGRYHAPYMNGRVRSAETDHDLAIPIKAIISPDGRYIQNLPSIASVLQNNPSYHGDGTVFLSYCHIDYDAAFSKAEEMQRSSPLPYGPFIRNGSNCSRFVNTVIRAGKPGLKQVFRLRYFVPFTPTPMNNVNALDHEIAVPPVFSSGTCVEKRLSPEELKTTLAAPERHTHIPADAQWLSGEGAGSWFHISHFDYNYRIVRYSPDGEIECSGLFVNDNEMHFNLNLPYKVSYLSHCNQITLQQNGYLFTFERLSAFKAQHAIPVKMETGSFS
jgi:hypothetical protein